MQFSMITVAAAAMATVASAYSNGTASAVWVTDVVTAYTTFCPASTVLTAYGHTYTVTSATTLTLPCPCTSSYVVTATPVAYCKTCAVAPTPAAYTNGTTPSVPTTATDVVLVTPTSVGTVVAVPTTAGPSATFTGAANKVAGSAAGLAGVLGMAAYLL